MVTSTARAADTEDQQRAGRRAVLNIASGYDVGYLTDAVGSGGRATHRRGHRRRTTRGVWYGAGLSYSGYAARGDAQQMRSIYAKLRDPRDPDGEALLGHARSILAVSLIDSDRQSGTTRKPAG